MGDWQEGAVGRIAWDNRYFASTRGQVLTLLRRAPSTVDDLSTSLEISDNAVRSHLYALERDGFVIHEGIRRGVGKPSWLYRLTPDAERLFPKPYASVLDTLLSVLGDRLPAEEIDAALAEVGRRLASTVPPPVGSIEDRMPAVLDTLANMGGMAEIDTSDHVIVIRGYDCPIAGAVRQHPDACRVVQSMLETMLGTPVVDSCDRSDQPRCCFAIQRSEPRTAPVP